MFKVLLVCSSKGFFVNVLFSLSKPWQFATLLLGNLSGAGIQEFWDHIKSQKPWQHHEVLHSLSDLSRVIPCTIHADGAELFSDTEYFVYSWGSALSMNSLFKDVLVQKYPIAIIAEREMQSESVP